MDDEAEKKPGEEVVTLSYPVDYKAELREDITIRRPKMADIKKISANKGSDAEKAALMIQVLSGWAPQAVDLLDTADIDKISKVIDSFS